MKKLFSFVISAMVLCACTSIDTSLDNLEKAYQDGDKDKAFEMYIDIYNNQLEDMDDTQMERLIAIQTKYDSEWHYDDVDDGEPDAMDRYFARHPEYFKTEEKSYSGGGLIFKDESDECYYFCAGCGYCTFGRGTDDWIRLTNNENPMHCRNHRLNYVAKHVIGGAVYTCTKCGLTVETTESRPNNCEHYCPVSSRFDNGKHNWERIR